MPTSRRAAFTLVELLVVIGVIAVLAGIFFPVFAHARKKGWQVRCAANMRQIHTTLVAYSEDYGGLLPPATTKVPGGEFATPWQGNLDIVWWDLVLPYVGSPKILYCPSAPPHLPGYWINAKLTFLKPGSLDDCTQPGSTILIFDGSVPDRSGENLYIPASSFMRPDINDNAFRHSDGMNAGFADGHVKRVPAEDVLQGSPLWEVVKTE